MMILLTFIALMWMDFRKKFGESTIPIEYALIASLAFLFVLVISSSFMTGAPSWAGLLFLLIIL